MKIKTLSLAFALLCVSVIGVGSSALAQDSSPHHAAMHAEHWVNHHVSAPHKKVRHRRIKHDKSTHHAAMHAEHWLDHHVSAPHKHQ